MRLGLLPLAESFQTPCKPALIKERETCKTLLQKLRERTKEVLLNTGANTAFLIIISNKQDVLAVLVKCISYFGGTDFSF